MKVSKLLILLYASAALLFSGCMKEPATTEDERSYIPFSVDVNVGRTYDLDSKQA